MFRDDRLIKNWSIHGALQILSLSIVHGLLKVLGLWVSCHFQ